MVFTDLFYLDYFGTSTHFAPHSLLAVGYDPTTDADGKGKGAGGSPASDATGGSRDIEGTVRLSDSEFPGVQTLPVARLRAAMTSEHVVPVRSRRLWVTDPDPDRGFGDAARSAIHSTARDLLGVGESPDGFGSEDPPDVGTPRASGIAGIRAFAEDLPAYAGLPDPSWTVRFAYQNVERRGTGGGAFRRLYAAFLSTAGDRIPGVPGDAGERMSEIADAWTDVGYDLKAISEIDDGDEASEVHDALEDARDDLLGIADREERLFGDLLDALD